MRCRILTALLVVFVMVTSCKREGIVELPPNVSKETDRIIRDLGESSYDNIYASFSPPLKKAWPKEFFISCMSELRKAVGAGWDPRERSFVVSIDPQGQYGFSYSLTHGRASEYTFDFSLSERGRGYVMVRLEARMPYPSHSPVAAEPQRVSERFLRLLAEDRIREAQTMIMEPAFGFPESDLAKLGAMYRDMRGRGRISRKFRRLFIEGSRMETLSVTENSNESPDFEVYFAEGKQGALVVMGYSL